MERHNVYLPKSIKMEKLKQIWFDRRRAILMVTGILLIVVLFFIRVAQVKEERRLLLKYDEEFDLDYVEPSLEVDEQKLLATKKTVQKENGRKKVLNINKFGPLRKDNFIVVIQIPKFGERYQRDNFVLTLEFLSRAAGINKALLIFSHSHYDDETNNVIQDIDFARVLQIYYPYSIQLYPNVFPGNDFKFCEDELSCETNGTFRNATLTEYKHHWWWTVNEVFDNLWLTKKFDNFVVFLEADDCVTEDFLYILLSLEQVAKLRCRSCIFSLNSNIPTVTQYNASRSVVYFNVFKGQDHRSGLAFNRTTWKIIRKHGDAFCNFNDYKWQNSLQYLGYQTEKNSFYVLYTEGPRIMKITDYGYGFVSKFFQVTRKELFPKSVEVQKVKNYKQLKANHTINENGQWRDRRDKELCVFMTNVKIIYDLSTPPIQAS